MIGGTGLLWNLWKTGHDVRFQQKVPKDHTNVIFSPCQLQLSVCARWQMRCSEDVMVGHLRRG
jgi:hypothetical protein